MAKMTYEDMCEKYTFVPNTMIEDGPYDGNMFETYGEELEFVKSKPYKNIWTIVDGSGPDMWVINGFHLVNRMGYLITNEEGSEDEDYLIGEYFTAGEAYNTVVYFLEQEGIDLTEDQLLKLEEQFLNF